MSLFWQLLQDHRYFKERDKAENLESRVRGLEQQAAALQDLLKQVLYALETHLGDDIDKDGVVGKPQPPKIIIRRKKRPARRPLVAPKHP